MFEHFAKKIQVHTLVKMQKKNLKSLFSQNIKKVKTCSFPFFRVGTWKINVFFRTKSNFRLDLVLTNFLYKITIEK